MQTLVVVLHIIAAIVIVGLVLLQQGKGADAGASFGSGASQTVFGASGGGNFLVRSTTIAATIFFVTSLSLAIFARNDAGIGPTTELPIANEAILEEALTAPANDLPSLDDIPTDTALDNLPNDASDAPPGDAPLQDATPLNNLLQSDADDDASDTTTSPDNNN